MLHTPITYRPQGHDAPKHSEEWTNFKAAEIAAREVRGKAIHCPVHRASLEAWQRGETAWPWPRLADAELVRLSRVQNRLVREGVR
jgi:hypothetical protein